MFENPTVNLNALCNSCANIACCSSELITFLYAGSSTQNASEQFVSCSHFLLPTSLFSEPHKEKYNGVGSVDANSSISVTIQN
jgi:hypothetical protein